jgi:hypothetical protein
VCRAEEEVAGQVRSIDRRQYLTGGCDGETTYVDERANEAKPVPVRLAVLGLVSIGRRTRRQKSLAQVVLDGGDARPAGSAQLSDSHADRLLVHSTFNPLALTASHGR